MVDAGPEPTYEEKIRVPALGARTSDPSIQSQPLYQLSHCAPLAKRVYAI